MYLRKTYLLLFFGLLVLLTLYGYQYDNRGEGSVANDITVEWELHSNSVEEGGRFRSAFTLENKGSKELKNTGWSLYFNFRHHIVEETVSDIADITFINGDFYRLSPTQTFHLKPGERTVIEFEGRGSMIKDDRAPAGLYFVFADEQGDETDTTFVEDYSFKRIEPGQVIRALQNIPDAGSRFRDNQPVEKMNVDDLSPIIPTPLNFQYSGETVHVNEEYQINYETGLENEASFVADALGDLLDIEFRISEDIEKGPGVISILLDEKLISSSKTGAYQLDISNEKGISIRASEAAGIFYGIQSLINLVPADSFRSSQSSLALPGISINDAPRFQYRGMHLDVSRNFSGKEAVFKLLDLMAFYKLNKFHFHLTDDEGWRLQIEELPELTEVGSFRGHTRDDQTHLQPAYGSGPYPDPKSSYGSGYYTREDYKEIIRYAHERHIEVIPEFDVPGHARAAIKSMEARYRRLIEEGREEEAEEYLLTDWNDESVYSSAQDYNDNVISVCKESAYRFFEVIIDDVSEMHVEADVPLRTIHMGGDEVPEGSWGKSPVCDQFLEENDTVDGYDDLPNYFIDRLTGILGDRNLILAGWQEIAMRGGGHDGSEIDPAFTDQQVTIYSWDNFTGGNRDLGYRVANAGFPVVLCNATNLYFELAYNGDPAEPGDYFGGFVDTRKAFEFMPMNFTDPMHEEAAGKSYEQLNTDAEDNIKGIQAHLWSEPIKGRDSLEYFYAPKILGLAERAWAGQPEWETMRDRAERNEVFLDDWSRFANRIGRREMPRLDYLFGGYNYRLPLPGAVIKDDMVHANVEFPGLTIRYTTDGNKPTAQSERYIEPFKAEGEIKLRVFDSRESGSRVTTVNPEKY